jgi:hypothetical protein
MAADIRVDAQDVRVQELEAELTTLRSELAGYRSANEGSGMVSHRRLRNVSAGILVALVSVFSAVALLAVWLSTTLLDTDQYVKTVSPLASDPQVQTVIADRVADQLFTQVDVSSAIANALPTNAQALAEPLASQFHGFVEDQVKSVMDTQAFTTTWEAANRTTHTQIVNLLLGNEPDGVVQSSDGTVSIDLHALAQQVLTSLQDRGDTLFENVPIDKVNGRVELVQSQTLHDVSTGAKTLHTLRYVAPILLVVLIVGALLVAPNRRKVSAWLGVSVLVGMALISIGLAVGRQEALDQASSLQISSDAALAGYDTITRFLRRSTQVGYVLALIVIFAALFTGKGRMATAAHRVVNGSSERLAHVLGEQGLLPVSMSVWIEERIAVLRIAVITAGALTLYVWSSPTVTVVLSLLAATLVLLLALETARRFSVDLRNSSSTSKS